MSLQLPLKQFAELNSMLFLHENTAIVFIGKREHTHTHTNRKDNLDKTLVEKKHAGLIASKSQILERTQESCLQESSEPTTKITEQRENQYLNIWAQF